MSPQGEARSAVSKNGDNHVQFIDELWALVQDQESPLQIVLSTKDGVFDYVPIRVWWTHGRFPSDRSSAPEHSQIVFDIPDSVWAKVQSVYATKVKRRFFGSTKSVNLSAPIRSQTDETRRLDPEYFNGEGFTCEVFTTDDWPRVRQAIEATAASRSQGLSSPNIILHGRFEGKARVNDGRIEINIDSAITQIIGNWQTGIRRKLGFPN